MWKWGQALKMAWRLRAVPSHCIICIHVCRKKIKSVLGSGRSLGFWYRVELPASPYRQHPVLHTPIETIGADRRKTIDHTAIVLRERGPAQPEAIATLFYPGRTIGHEFMYIGQEEKELERERSMPLYPYQIFVKTSYLAQRAVLCCV
jgi:hypothetical protein